MNNKNSLFTFDIPSEPKDHRVLANIIASSDVFAISQMADQYNGLSVVVTPDTRIALNLERALNQFSELEIDFFADWETLPYDSFSPHQDIISNRLSTLFNLQHRTKAILILSISTLMQRLCPLEFLMNNVFIIKNGDKLSIAKIRTRLEKAGYRAVEQVLEHGEYAVRGALLDIFPMGSADPFRLDFFDDEVDSIRTFDVDSQRTMSKIDAINLLPAHEFPIDEPSIEFFRSQFRETFSTIRREPEHIYQQISKGILPAGVEYWQPLFFHNMATLFDFLPDNVLFIDFKAIQLSGAQFYADAEKRYKDRAVDPMRPLLPPNQLWLKIEEINHQFTHYPRVTLLAKKLEKKSAGKSNLNVQALPELTIYPQQKEPLRLLRQFIDNFTGQIVFSAETKGRKEILTDLLAPLKINPRQISHLAGAIEQRFSIIIGAIEHGFTAHLDDVNLSFALISEADLSGQPVRQKQNANKRTINPDALIRNLAELKIDQAVVHQEHGVGRYGGLTTIENAGVLTEFLVLIYANQAKLYVPVSSLHLISRYIGGADENAPLHKLGSDVWAKARHKAIEKIRDVAAELLDIYAQRESQKGFAFTHHREELRQFAASFPFEETLDQQQAIDAVISDMCQAKAMDRLICGDVGFGKTEVAMRAAFLSVMNNKQVALLVPTTLLAQQHYDNFKDRFANLPVNIELISRFKTATQQKKILQQVTEGKIDILIGTHKLIQSDVKFHDLGLLIVDEEHRFGVRQKEKIKQLRANIDILTLTATPIPRTLNMAMHGIRDLSIIATPPARRLSIKTFVRETDNLTIREAILREISRGGQVYYLHNEVVSIEACAEKLAHLVPEAKIIIGHGQMRERELERVMSDFHRQRYNVLVCSTIIETGIDVPTANTIIIDRADHFGLAQLHQLRGRVGRSHHQAYAYLLTPPKKLISKDAQKRLETLESLDNLGAGFALATHDLEIRGAGEFLGNEQSGQIESIGFSLYMEFLDNAVKALKEGREPSLEELTQQQVEIDLRIPALIPENYINDVNTRLYFYKQIASAENKSALDDIKIELIDRFGLLPQASKNLMDIAELRLLAKPLAIQKIESSAIGGYIEFEEKADIDPVKLLTLIQAEPQIYRFDGPQKFRFNVKFEDVKQRLAFVHRLISDI